jgi:hypothetical protein
MSISPAAIMKGRGDEEQVAGKGTAASSSSDVSQSKIQAEIDDEKVEVDIADAVGDPNIEGYTEKDQHDMYRMGKVQELRACS